MKIFIYEKNGVRGSGIRGETDRLFIIQKGSGVVGDHKVKKSLNWSERSKLRKELISNGTLTKSDDHYRFQKDHTFNSPSQAASIICGNNRNGNIFTLSDENFLIDSKRISTSSNEIFPIDSERAMEGYKEDLKLYRSKRNAKLAERRKKQDDYTCQACGFRLEVSGHFVIECHHINPISLGERKTGLDDLVSLCPTCHRIAHTRKPIYQVEEIASIRQN